MRRYVHLLADTAIALKNEGVVAPTYIEIGERYIQVPLWDGAMDNIQGDLLLVNRCLVDRGIQSCLVSQRYYELVDTGQPIRTAPEAHACLPSGPKTRLWTPSVGIYFSQGDDDLVYAASLEASRYTGIRKAMKGNRRMSELTDGVRKEVEIYPPEE
mgnify:CR=1 FL=1